MGVGAVCLGLTFARLARLAPVTGGPYAYTRLAYGDFAGFLIAWGYWISICASLPAIAVAFTGYLTKMIPAFHGSRPIGIALTLGAIWFVTLVNLRGVKESGLFTAIATFTKLIPFGGICVLGLFYVQWDRLSAFNPSGQTLLAASAALAPLTMFAYLGLESATVPAGETRDAERTVPLATMIGIGIAALVYVLGTVVVMGVVPRDSLVKSGAPFSDAAGLMWGGWAATVVSIAVVISSLGSLNGWTLLMGQVPMAAARDGLFPAVFGRLSSRGVPATGIVVSTILTTLLVVAESTGSPGLVAFYQLVVNLSTMVAVIPYAFCALAGGLVAARVFSGRAVPRISWVEVVAFLFSIFTVYGCGPRPVMFGLLLLLLGIPVFVWQRQAQVRVGRAR